MGRWLAILACVTSVACSYRKPEDLSDFQRRKVEDDTREAAGCAGSVQLLAFQATSTQVPKWRARCDGKVVKCIAVPVEGSITAKTTCVETRASMNRRHAALRAKLRKQQAARAAERKKRKAAAEAAERAEVEKLPLPSPEGHRSAKWGMSRTEAREALKDEFGDGLKEGPNGALYGRGRAGPFDAMIGYAFTQDQLAWVKVKLTDEDHNQNAYIDRYNRLKTLLSKKYGKPVKDEQLWSARKKAYGADVSQWGFAVSAGYLTLFSQWRTPHTEVFLACRGKNFKSWVVVEYLSRALKFKVRAQQEKKRLKSL